MYPSMKLNWKSSSPNAALPARPPPRARRHARRARADTLRRQRGLAARLLEHGIDARTIGRRQRGVSFPQRPKAFHLILERALLVRHAERLEAEGFRAALGGFFVGEQEREIDATREFEQTLDDRGVASRFPFAVDAGKIVDMHQPTHGEGCCGAQEIVGRGV